VAVELSGAVAIVTGAAAGAGRAIALRLGAEGATVVVADVDAARGADTEREIDARGGRASFVQTDVTSEGDVRTLLEYADRLDGPARLLVNNAGGGGHIPPHFPDATPAQWGMTLDLNLRGPMLATQLALQAMRRDGGGAIVNVASTAGLGLAPYHSPEYGASKAGLIRFTTCLADLHERFGVRVTCLVPDWLGTERAIEEYAGLTPEERAANPPPIPLEEVADAVLELAGDESLAGRVMVLDREEPRRRLLDAAGP
jgi:NAD(P)-dependent dehydrogenase (short-subunit alcohol dehydrogenase family)